MDLMTKSTFVRIEKTSQSMRCTEHFSIITSNYQFINHQGFRQSDWLFYYFLSVLHASSHLFTNGQELTVRHFHPSYHLDWKDDDVGSDEVLNLSELEMWSVQSWSQEDEASWHFPLTVATCASNNRNVGSTRMQTLEAEPVQLMSLTFWWS